MNSFGQVCNSIKEGPQPQEAIGKGRWWRPAPDKHSTGNGVTLQIRSSLGMAVIILLALAGVARAGESGTESAPGHPAVAVSAKSPGNLAPAPAAAGVAAAANPPYPSVGVK